MALFDFEGSAGIVGLVRYRVWFRWYDSFEATSVPGPIPWPS